MTYNSFSYFSYYISRFFNKNFYIHFFTYFFVSFFIFHQSHTYAAELHPDFLKAIELIHAYSGSGNEQQQAYTIAKALSTTHPKSGYSETIYAEDLSTWVLNQDDLQPQLPDQILRLCDTALKMNPNLAHAYVPRGRVFVRTSMYDQANISIDAALRLDPKLSGALFLRADIYRKRNQIKDAEEWYLKFIESTSSLARKSNGYYWIGKGYHDAAFSDIKNRELLTAKARHFYEIMLKLEPTGAWRNVNFAIFLNEYAADFQTAEIYARKALAEKNFGMARYHLAASQYQQLLTQSLGMSKPALDLALKKIAASSDITLKEAISFRGFSFVIRERLAKLQERFINAPSPASI